MTPDGVLLTGTVSRVSFCRCRRSLLCVSSCLYAGVITVYILCVHYLVHKLSHYHSIDSSYLAERRAGYGNGVSPYPRLIECPCLRHRWMHHALRAAANDCQVGDNMSVEDAAAAARLVALNMLATLKCEFKRLWIPRLFLLAENCILPRVARPVLVTTCCVGALSGTCQTFTLRLRKIGSIVYGGMSHQPTYRCHKPS